MNTATPGDAPRNWPVILMFALTALAAVTLVPWYGFAHGYRLNAWLWFVFFLSANELAITCGYHRLFAHATYQANPVLKVVYLLFGAMALQNSALIWAAGHRAHHLHIDDPERDPYCARRGFWFSHLGWMIRDYPSGRPDYGFVRDLQKDPLVAFQHRYYLPLALLTNIGLPLLAGWWSGELIGVFLLGGVLRLVASHHLTFLINSAAHQFGTQPYTSDNTARDNPIIAVFTFGEGYHNFHHMFQNDYRNGVHWWQWDPSKWFIRAMSWLGLARNLKRVPWFRIRRVQFVAQFQRAELGLAAQAGKAHALRMKDRLAEEYAAFQDAVANWTRLREQFVSDARQSAGERWERSLLQARLREIERSLSQQVRRMRALCAELA